MTTFAAEPPIIISTTEINGEKQFLLYSDPEANRAALTWERLLSKTSIKRGEYTIVITAPEDAHLAMPLERTLELTGVIILQADSTQYEAQRVEAFIRNFDPVAIFGINAAIVSGLSSLGHNVGKLLNTRQVWATDDGFAALQHMKDIRLRRWSRFGPAVLISCGHHETAMHIDDTEWDISTESHQTTLRHRLNAAEPDPVILTHAKMTRLNELCPCGLTDPLVDVSAFNKPR